MWGFLLGLFWKAVGFFQNKPPPPTRPEILSRELGATETKLQAKVQNDHAVEAAIAAVDAVRTEQLRAPDREAEARAPDRYSRD